MEGQGQVFFLHIGQLQDNPGLRKQHSGRVNSVILKKEENKLDIFIQKTEKEVWFRRQFSEHILRAIYKVEWIEPYIL